MRYTVFRITLKHVFFFFRPFPEDLKMSIIDRWATHPLLIKAIGSRISDELKKFPESDRDDVIILFSAHSLPLKVILNKSLATEFLIFSDFQVTQKMLILDSDYTLEYIGFIIIMNFVCGCFNWLELLFTWLELSFIRYLIVFYL